MSIWPFKKSRSSNAARVTPDNPPNSRCSFCGRPRAVVGPMVEGPNDVYICVECVRLAHEIAEGNRMQPANTDLNDAQVCRAGHMHIRCYFSIEHASDGTWRAVSRIPAGYSAQGSSPREAVRAMQSQMLEFVAKSFVAGGDVGDYFTNHADERLR